jgi:hypothetical protein
MRALSVMQAKELQSSEVWQAFLVELDERVRICYQQMTNCKSDELIKFQAKLQTYQEVKGILQAVIDREE